MAEEDWSVPETEVFATLRDHLDAGRPAVVATVIRVQGSAYRRPGAKMVIEPEGEGVGSITAGCLEDEVLELAAEVLDDGRPRLETYDLMEGEDDVWGLGVGCNGVIDILLEPLTDDYRPAIDALDDGDRVGVLTAVSGDGVEIGARGYYRAGDGVAAGGLPDWLADAVAEPAAALVADGSAETVRIETDAGEASVFVDGLAPSPHLVVFGSGHDVAPVVELAKRNDFRVTVAAFRGAADVASTFPEADAAIKTTPATVREAVDFDADTYAVVMTHNFIDDRLALDELVQTPASYVGLMGPRDRFEEMLDEFDAEGRSFSDDELDPVYTPIGLDLGGGSPYQIATSIVAEVLAVANDRPPRHLKEREGPIHDRTAVDAAEIPR